MCDVKALVKNCDKDHLGKLIGVSALAIVGLGGAIFLATKLKK
ncbi:MAG: hypothetical protein ACRDCB_02650 [Clostridium sp.]|nr:hypothetical protein [Clostridium chrysemydis]